MRQQGRLTMRREEHGAEDRRESDGRGESGQSTVEYAVVLAAFMVVVVGLGALLQAVDAGTFVDHALSAASHHLHSSAAGVVDVFAY